MKRSLLIQLYSIVFLLFLCSFLAHSQSIEMSDRFREVVQKLVRKQFKNVVFNELKDNDPILAASTYDLIDRVISGDSLSEIRKQIIVSTFDYIEFLSLREHLKQSFPYSVIVRFDSVKVTENDYAKLMSLSSLLTYQYLAGEDLLVVSEGVTKIITDYSDFYAKFKPVPGYPSAVTFDGSIGQFMDSNKIEILRSIRLNVLLKDVVVSLSGGNAISNKLRAEYEDTLRKHFLTDEEFLKSIQDTVRTLLLKLRDEVGNFSNKAYADLFAVVAPYVNAIIFQKLEQQPIDYSKQLMTAFVGKLESIYADKKTGFKYRLGLWSGLFVSGATWDPPTTSYPVVSLRINDRLQYTFSDSVCGEWFFYLGGFSDVLIKELANKQSNQFGYIGLGATVSSFSFAVSATVPVNRDVKDIGCVVSMMYDLPIEELFK